ncbi:MAG TPA: hypothetical protein DEB10_04855, partial [Ruminococcaceae bacterium]|nr:hypothetical protein [Oscillospiraceae bacterium]
DLNLFFLRIMKEHSFFLQIAFTPVNSQMASEARNFRIGFEKLLSEATNLANGNVSEQAVESKQFVTQFTVDAEKLTNFYTGVPFNTNLTKREVMLTPSDGRHAPVSEHAVDSLNRKSYQLTSALAEFKDRLLRNVLSCKVFTLNYPLLIEHILREARFFMAMLDALNENRGNISPFDLINQEVFWNRQMAEHAKFIAGLLDPTEEMLINTARMFGKEFDELTAESKQASRKTFDIMNTTRDSISAMMRLRDFKTAGTQGLLDCNIKSIIVPLLADHVLREANHYLCVLGVCGADRV